RNAAESPYRYLIDPDEQLKVWMELDDADEVVWAIVHSHVASPAVPSATDVGLAFYPDSLYVIVSLADPKSPSVRAWSIREGTVTVVGLAVTA
ncbi:MAG: M67 family metallopeptidase, partial [Chloroflexota bacterium]